MAISKLQKIGGSIDSNIQLVNPFIAREMLQQNSHNRRLSPSIVEKLARAMSEGKWRMNGQTIVISKDNDLLDGQHRLEAIILSGANIPLIVVRGVDFSAFPTLDTGKIRNAADVLSIEGHQNTVHLAGTIRMVLGYIHGKTNFPFSSQEILNFSRDNADIQEHVTLCRTARATINGISLASVMWLASRDGMREEAIREFVDKIQSGENLSKGDPVHTLREWSIAAKRGLTSGDSLSRLNVFAMTAQAWTARQKGQKQTKMNGVRHPYFESEIAGYVTPRNIDKIKELRFDSKLRAVQ